VNKSILDSIRLDTSLILIGYYAGVSWIFVKLFDIIRRFWESKSVPTTRKHRGVMDIFDDTIAEIRNWFEKKTKTGSGRFFQIPETRFEDDSFHEKTAGEKNPSIIILREDTHLELGHPSVGSCCATLATQDLDLVRDGRITLVGPDIPETHEERLSFGQIIVVALKDVSSPDATAVIDRTVSLMDRIAHSAAQSPGYMIRSVPNQIWARVSKEAAREGFSLKQLGERLMFAIKQHCDLIETCEIYFATGKKADIESLDDIVEIARAKKRKLEELKFEADGEYACTRDQDCGTCPEQVVCDTIRDVIEIRKGDRVITLERDAVKVRTL
jgi:hypothetical protein